MPVSGDGGDSGTGVGNGGGGGTAVSWFEFPSTAVHSSCFRFCTSKVKKKNEQDKKNITTQDKSIQNHTGDASAPPRAASAASRPKA